jgi:hypothetical protein
MSAGRPTKNEIVALAEQVKQIEAQEEALADRKAVLYQRMAEVLAQRTAQAPVSNANGERPSALPPLKSGSKGQGARLVALVRERPGCNTTWLCEHLYGADTDENRQRLSSLTSYTIGKGKLGRDDGGKLGLPEAKERAMTK